MSSTKCLDQISAALSTEVSCLSCDTPPPDAPQIVFENLLISVSISNQSETAFLSSYFRRQKISDRLPLLIGCWLLVPHQLMVSQQPKAFIKADGAAMRDREASTWSNERRFRRFVLLCFVLGYDIFLVSCLFGRCWGVVYTDILHTCRPKSFCGVLMWEVAACSSRLLEGHQIIERLWRNTISPLEHVEACWRCFWGWKEVGSSDSFLVNWILAKLALRLTFTPSIQNLLSRTGVDLATSMQWACVFEDPDI